MATTELQAQLASVQSDHLPVIESFTIGDKTITLGSWNVLLLAFFAKYAHQHLPCQKLTNLLPCVSSTDLQKLLTELTQDDTPEVGKPTKGKSQKDYAAEDGVDDVMWDQMLNDLTEELNRPDRDDNVSNAQQKRLDIQAQIVCDMFQLGNCATIAIQESSLSFLKTVDTLAIKRGLNISQINCCLDIQGNLIEPSDKGIQQCILYDSSKIELLSNSHVQYIKTINSFMLAVFKIVDSDEFFILGNTHVPWNKWGEFVKIIDNYKEQNVDEMPFIICGDLNCDTDNLKKYFLDNINLTTKISGRSLESKTVGCFVDGKPVLSTATHINKNGMVEAIFDHILYSHDPDRNSNKNKLYNRN